MNNRDDSDRYAKTLRQLESSYGWLSTCMEFKKSPLSEEEKLECQAWLKNPTETEPGYLKTSTAVCFKQLKEKTGCRQLSDLKYLEETAHRMAISQLKYKLGRTITKPSSEGARVAIAGNLDPHFHINSIFTLLNQDARYGLPNFDRVYPMINPNSDLDATNDEVKKTFEQFMKDETTPKFVEAQCFNVAHGVSLAETKDKELLRLRGFIRFYDSDVHSDGSYDVCGHESKYESLKYFLSSFKEYSTGFCRIHMGETNIPAHGKENVKKLLEELKSYYKSKKPIRIGHGTHMSIESMKEVAAGNHYVEACLSSNKKTGILRKRSEYPLGVMLLLGVKVVIGTDGGPLYDTNLHLEYTYAERNLTKFKAKIDKGLDEPIKLPNGDCLQWKDLEKIIDKSIIAENTGKTLTFADLKKVLSKEIIDQRLSLQVLLDNLNSLKKLFYPSLWKKETETLELKEKNADECCALKHTS